MRPWMGVALGFFLCFLVNVPLRGQCCGISDVPPKTLRDEAKAAKIVLYGTLLNPRKSADESEYFTDLIIHHTYKSHLLVKDKRKVTLSAYVAEKDLTAVIVFADAAERQIEPFKAIPVRTQGVVDYVRGALALREKDETTALAYFFRYLKHEQVEVAEDAYLEWAKASPQHFRAAATKLNPEAVVALLRDSKIPPFKLGLCGLMLGHCGRDKHARLLRELLATRPDGADFGLLVGYTLLKPLDGMAYIRTLQAEDGFINRYAGLRALRFFWKERPDVVPKKDVVEAVTAFLPLRDIADFAIEDLRRWSQWQQTDKVLEVWDQKAGQVPIVRRAILRFALRSPGPSAAAFVREQRRRDPDWVSDTEALLALEEEDQKKRHD